MAVNLQNRGIRFAELIDAGKLKTTHADVVGVGAIGRQVALMLAGIGIKHMSLWDFDSVDVENIGPQGYPESSVGKQKVRVTGNNCPDVYNKCNLAMHNKKWEPTKIPSGLNRTTFVCLDSMKGRSQVAEGVNTDLLIDVRMASESFCVYSSYWELDPSRYTDTLYTDENAVELPCTNKATPYCANIGAGIAVSQFSKWLRGNALEHKILFNIVAVELSVED